MKRKFDLPLTITLAVLALFVFIPMLSAFEFSIRTPVRVAMVGINICRPFEKKSFSIT